VATLAEVARGRRAQLKNLLVASRRLDASQERVEREVKRLVTRKKSIPEAADVARLTGMIQQTEAALGTLTSVLAELSASWTL